MTHYDEKPRKRRNADKLPYAYKISLCNRPKAPEGVISWFDRERFEYVTFKTHADMLRYAMCKLLIPNELVSSLLSAHPRRKWDECDVSIIKAFYYCGYDYDEIMNHFK